MEFLAGLAIGFALAFLIIHVIAKIYLRMQSDKLDEAIQSGLSKLKETIIPARIEDVNGILFLYNRETEEFLAQGKDMTELNRSARERFPDKLFNVPQDELDKFLKKEKNA